MNKETLRGQWNQVKGSLKKNWGRLTDDDIKKIEGSYDQLVGRIQERYGQSIDEARKSVDEFFATKK
ncbi:MAG: CsbD family protein [Halobacteriovoraceae bacterium]|nr:CsbD family protein [Halobacteriovoraceae bacterium]MCB9095294.1 CsbD family protein [Halobacteriovoraceae bacterium]